MKYVSVLVLGLVLSVASFADSPIKRAKAEFSESKAVKVALKDLKAKGYSKLEPLSAVIVSGGCGFAGCDTDVLVVQAASTNFGANPQTASVSALVHVPAVGDLSLKLAKIKTSEKINLPWTSSSDSTQAVLKDALVEAMEADKASEFPMGDIKGNNRKVTVDDGKSKVSCSERKAPGLIQIQQYSCTFEVK